jgi:hypothetical protein
MKKLGSFEVTQLPTHMWRNFYYDDKYYQNEAILDLNMQPLEKLIPGLTHEEYFNLLLAEHHSILFSCSNIFPSPLIYSCQ